MVDEDLKKQVIQDVVLLKLVALSRSSSMAEERKSASGWKSRVWSRILSMACG